VASFFPKVSYVLKVRGKGFLRYQIRLMMGALVCLGRSEISLENFKQLLETDLDGFVPYVAAGSGLHLKELIFDLDLPSV
jgi:tRNA pseudouridine38-40 synthase